LIRIGKELEAHPVHGDGYREEFWV
jgi:hypothetical protein